MPQNASREAQAPRAYEFLNDDSRASARISLWLALIAGGAILANCLLTSPSRFSEKQSQDTSLLGPVVGALGLWGKCPTVRGVEIRNLVFYVAAACLAMLGGLRLLLATRGPRLTFDDLLDLRARCAGPYFWWILLLLVAFFSSYYAHAQKMCFGQLTIRFLQTAWWIPLATFLTARHARGLSTTLTVALALTAALGLWYYFARVAPEFPGRRLQYPIGNELWMGACLLPGLFIAAGLAMGRYSPVAENVETSKRRNVERAGRAALMFLAIGVIAGGVYLTKSRSAQVGAIVGICVGLCFITSRMTRRVILLACVVAALLGSFWLHRVLQEGDSGQRVHSIRSRVQYEWPYALHLFFQKPFAGNGDGAYAMLAGRLARDDQLEDPSTIRFDEWSWPGHAHNEFLELLSDLGLVGMISYLVALGLTLYRALQFCDRCPSSAADMRWLAIGLSAALAAMVVDQCFEPAIREPGLPPIFFTVWACLWAVVREQQPIAAVTHTAEGGYGPCSVGEGRDIIRPSGLRIAGALTCAIAAVLGWYGLQDWRGVRARFEAASLLDGQQYATAAANADFAGEHLLDPFQRAQARMISVWARSLEFDETLAASNAPLSRQQLDESEDALVRLVKLDDDVPRFLRLSRLGSELHLNRARAFARMGDKNHELESQAKFVSALLQNQKDEPFLIDRVVALWKARPESSAMERLRWMRCLMRAGEVDDDFVQLFRSLPAHKDFGPALNDLYNIAMKDAGRLPGQWDDPLSPETLRMAALAKALSDDMTEAVKLAQAAEALYAKAGARLFAGRAAAMHDEVRYRFIKNPLGEADLLLNRLAEADGVLGGTANATTPLVGPLGQTRLRILVASGRDDAARIQLAKSGVAEDELPRRLASAMANVASRYLLASGRSAEGLRLAEHAVRIAPDSPETQWAYAEACLASGMASEARVAGEAFVRFSADREAAQSAWARLQERYTGGGGAPETSKRQNVKTSQPEAAKGPN